MLPLLPYIHAVWLGRSLLVKEVVEQQKVRTRDSLMSKYEKKAGAEGALGFVKRLQYLLGDVSGLLALDGDGKFVSSDTVGVLL